MLATGGSRDALLSLRGTDGNNCTSDTDWAPEQSCKSLSMLEMDNHTDSWLHKWLQMRTDTLRNKEEGIVHPKTSDDSIRSQVSTIVQHVFAVTISAGKDN